MSIVIAHHDPFTATRVAHELRTYFVRVAVATSRAELPHILQHQKALAFLP